LAFRRSTTGSGVGAIVSEGRGVVVTVSAGMSVTVGEGRGVNISVAGIPVAVSTGRDEGEAVVFPFVELQALIISITKMSVYELLALIFLFY
jgi:hypothetical protein